MSEVRAYLDSNVFVYFFEGRGADAEAAKRLFRESRDRKIFFVTSELTLAEVLAPSPVSLSGMSKRYLDLIAHNGSIHVRPVTREIILATPRERQETGHKLADSIHCVTATTSGCKYMVSRDREMRRLPSGITWLDLDEKGVTALLEAART